MCILLKKSWAFFYIEYIEQIALVNSNWVMILDIENLYILIFNIRKIILLLK